MPRFTPATEAALIKAGWFEGRVVPDEEMKDWLVINWLPNMSAPQGYSKISPIAWRVLREFGGLSIERLSIERDAQAHQPTYPFVTNPLLVPDCGAYNGGLESFVWAVGASLFPLGVVEFAIKSHATHAKPIAIAMGDDGRVFMLDYRCRLLGNSIEEALENIVSGEIDLQEPSEDNSDFEAGQAAQTQQVVRSIARRIKEREWQLMQGQWPDQPTTLGQNERSGFFAITDWNAEAARVARAFGVVGEYQFFGPHKMKRLVLKSRLHHLDNTDVALGDEWTLRVIYDTNARFLQLLDSKRAAIGVRLLWSGEAYTRNQQGFAAQQRFAKALFNLGLLTPEIEEQLQLNPTQHEKLEWQLEFEAWRGWE